MAREVYLLRVTLINLAPTTTSREVEKLVAGQCQVHYCAPRRLRVHRAAWARRWVPWVVRAVALFLRRHFRQSASRTSHCRVVEMNQRISALEAWSLLQVQSCDCLSLSAMWNSRSVSLSIHVSNDFSVGTSFSFCSTSSSPHTGIRFAKFIASENCSSMVKSKDEGGLMNSRCLTCSNTYFFVFSWLLAVLPADRWVIPRPPFRLNKWVVIKEKKDDG